MSLQDEDDDYGDGDVDYGDNDAQCSFHVLHS